MKNSILIFAICGSQLIADGQKVYENKCASCHEYYIPVEKLMDNFMNHKNGALKLKAPTVNQLNFRLKQMIGEPKGDPEFHKLEVTNFIKDYIINPDRQKSVCMTEVLDNFKTMDSMRGKLTDKELDDISNWIYDYTPPAKEKR